MDNAIAQRVATWLAGVKEIITPAEMNRFQDDDILLAAQLAGITQDTHYPHITTSDNKLAYTTSADTVTITGGQTLIIGGVRYNTSDLTNMAITIPDSYSGFVRAEVAADSGDVVDAGADPIVRKLTLEISLTTGLVSDPEGTGGGPSSPTSARLFSVTKAGGGTAPAVSAYVNEAHSAVSAAQVAHTHDADEVNYDNTTSGMAATDVQAALDEVSTGLGGMTLHADTGAADALVITPAPALTAYETGQNFWVEPTYDNTGACTINVNGLGAKSIKRPDGGDPGAYQLRAGHPTLLRYDGTNFEIIPNVIPINNQIFTSSGTFTAPRTGWYWVDVWGGGGGGATMVSTSGTSGAAGGYSGKWVYLAKDDTVTVTVGAGGAVATAGGASSFGAHCSATGGSAGSVNSTTQPTPGTGSSGDINLTGGPGNHNRYGAPGGAAPLGGPGGGCSDSAPGAGNYPAPQAGQIPGGGGASAYGQTATAGARGEVRVRFVG